MQKDTIQRSITRRHSRGKLEIPLLPSPRISPKKYKGIRGDDMCWSTCGDFSANSLPYRRTAIGRADRASIGRPSQMRDVGMSVMIIRTAFTG
jgi:hypothetical protein